jgi:hypothetical protein
MIDPIYLVSFGCRKSGPYGSDRVCRPCRQLSRLTWVEMLVAPEVGARRAALSPVWWCQEPVWSPVGKTAPVVVSEGDR